MSQTLTYEAKRLLEAVPFIKLANNGCHIWQGTKIKRGYGRIKVKGKAKLVHRFVYETLLGEVPEKLVLDHLCANQLCVNPFHLEAVTQAVNVKRGYERNGLKSHCINGHLFNDVNTHIYRGNRVCKTCRYNNDKRRKRL